MSLQITPSTQELTARSWVEKQFRDRNNEQGFYYPINGIADLIWSYLPVPSSQMEIMQRSNRSARQIADLTCYLPLLKSLSGLFSGLYESTFFPSNASLDQANIFLLGECHSPESTWRQLNGRFISYLSHFFPLIIFIEGYDFKEIPYWGTKEIRNFLQINSSSSAIRFGGWDFNGSLEVELQRDLSIREKLKKEMIILDKEMEMSNAKIEERVPGFFCMDEVTSSTALECLPFDETLSLCIEMEKRNVFFKNKLKLLGDCYRVEHILNVIIEETFPARTQAMVSALRAVRDWVRTSSGIQKTKFVFIAGATHLKEREPQIKEYSLAPLYEELSHHEAAVIMIPSIPDPVQTAT